MERQLHRLEVVGDERHAGAFGDAEHLHRVRRVRDDRLVALRAHGLATHVDGFDAPPVRPAPPDTK